MPKSKRNKVGMLSEMDIYFHSFLSHYMSPKSWCHVFSLLIVTLSKTQRKGRQQKESLLNEVRESFENYLEAYVFEFENMRNIKFKEFREELKDSSR